MSAIANAIRGIDVPDLQIKSGLFSGLSMRHVVLAVVFTAGYDVLGHLGIIDLAELSNASRWKGFGKMPFHLAIAFVAVPAAVAVDNRFTAGATRFMRYPAAALIAAVVGTWIHGVSSSPMSEPSVKGLAVMAKLGDVRLILLANHFLAALYIGILVVALYVVLEASHKAGSALHQARLQALDAERDVCAAELRAMQARVDPELLFESLRSVDIACERHPALGQAKSDELIRFLRAALPGKTAGRSTVEHEMELAEAYVALVATGNSSTHRLNVEATVAVLREVMPPMIVLPLVRWALANESAEGLTVSVIRRDTPSGTVLKLTIDNRGPVTAKTDNAATEIVRERLEYLFAKDVRFNVSAENSRRRAMVELPASAVEVRGPRLSAT